MKWYEEAMNPEAIVQLYQDVPSLEAVEIEEVNLYEEGARMSLRMNLPRFPDRPPKEWIEKRYNAAQVTLAFWGIEMLLIDGWGVYATTTVDIHLTEARKIAVSVISKSTHIQIVADSFEIARISGYWIAPKEC